MITLGKALSVNRLGYGAMRLCGPGVWGWPARPRERVARVARAVELGVNFIDTADAYGPHVNEEQIAQALCPYPADLLIATKGGSTRSGPGQWGRDGRPEYLNQLAREPAPAAARLHRSVSAARRRAERSVRRTDRRAAQAARCREDSLRRALKHRISTAGCEREASWRLRAVQNNYNVGNRASEPVLEHCEANGIAFIRIFSARRGRSAYHRGAASDRARARARPFGRSGWRGCCIGRRRCCRYRGRRRPSTSRRTMASASPRFPPKSSKRWTVWRPRETR